MEGYAKLPEETSELYKRHHSVVGAFGSLDSNEQAESASIEDFLKINKERLGMEFDAIIGSSCAILNNKNVLVSRPQDSEDLLKKMMHNNEDKYSAFVNAYSKRIISINFPKDEHREIKLLFLNHDQPLLSHVFMNADQDAKAKVVEVYASISTKPSAMAVMHEITSGNDSNFELDVIHNEDSRTTLLSFCRNSIGTNANLKFNTFYNGTSLTRVRNVMNATSKASRIEINEVVLGSSSQKFDIATQILNQGRESHASLESKAVLMDTSFCQLKGYARVLKGASGARSFVNERGILLDKGARVDGLPDMSVDESDVKATHSSATAPVDEETVFYLMSKGIPEVGVKKLIVSGFLGESISKMHNGAARNLAIELINHKLETKQFGAIPESNPENEWMFGEEREKDMFEGHYKYR
jgi:Fe-S cluster assembly scaffold protein SufB